jgi:hypothetical protein
MVKAGRKPGLKKDRRDEQITVPLTQSEKAQINDAAKLAGIPAAAFCRQTLLKVLEKK